MRRGDEIVLLIKQTPIPSSGKVMWDVGNCCAGSLGLLQTGAGWQISWWWRRWLPVIIPLLTLKAY